MQVRDEEKEPSALVERRGPESKTTERKDRTRARRGEYTKEAGKSGSTINTENGAEKKERKRSEGGGRDSGNGRQEQERNYWGVLGQRQKGYLRAGRRRITGASERVAEARTGYRPARRLITLQATKAKRREENSLEESGEEALSFSNANA